ncbi:MAG: enoyl-CoA hydratase/carnithine racemase [Kiritimatiellia bacterium]|jgi:enoyl-CoA hydratase/carnithine racemase
MNDQLHVEHNGDITVLTIDRPERRNALHQALWHGLRDSVRALSEAPPRVLVVTGSGGHFCSGMDLRMDNPLLARIVAPLGEGDEDALRSIIEELKACLQPLVDLPCPVIAAIEGSCFGAGLELALCADLRVAATSAKLSLPETRFGMVPDVGGSTRLSRLVGVARAAELILTAGQIDAAAAERWGLVNRLAPDGQALKVALDMAENIVACAPTATREALGVLRQINAVDDAASFGNETAAGARALLSGEIMEGAMAFAQRREPQW